MVSQYSKKVDETLKLGLKQAVSFCGINRFIKLKLFWMCLWEDISDFVWWFRYLSGCSSED